MKSFHAFTSLAVFCAIGVWTRPLSSPDLPSRRMTRYYAPKVSREVDLEADEKAKRMTMYYAADVSGEVDPEADEKAKRMTMYYAADVSGEVDPETKAADRA